MISLSSSFSPSREENVSHDFRNYFFARWLRTWKAHTSFTEGQLSTQRNEYHTTPHYVWIVFLRFSRVCFLSTILFVFLTFLLHSIKNELRSSCQWFGRTQCNKRGSTPTRVCFFIIASLSYSRTTSQPFGWKHIITLIFSQASSGPFSRYRKLIITRHGERLKPTMSTVTSFFISADKDSLMDNFSQPRLASDYELRHFGGLHPLYDRLLPSHGDRIVPA